jgi:hypothetical protein
MARGKLRKKLSVRSTVRLRRNGQEPTGQCAGLAALPSHRALCTNILQKGDILHTTDRVVDMPTQLVIIEALITASLD